MAHASTKKSGGLIVLQHSNAGRDAAIFRAWREGETPSSLARKHNISHQYVTMIVRAQCKRLDSNVYQRCRDLTEQLCTSTGLRYTGQPDLSVIRWFLSDRQSPVNLSILTAKERMVFKLSERGKTMAEIAKALNCAPGTVKKHRQNIISKMGMTSFHEIVVAQHLSYSA